MIAIAFMLVIEQIDVFNKERERAMIKAMYSTSCLSHEIVVSVYTIHG